MWHINVIIIALCLTTTTTATVKDDYRQFVKQFVDVFFNGQVELLGLIHDIMDSTSKDVLKFNEDIELVETVIRDGNQLKDFGFYFIMAALEGFSPNLNDEALHMVRKYIEVFFESGKRSKDPLNGAYLLTLVKHLSSPTPESEMDTQLVLKLIENKLGVGNQELKTIQSSVERANDMFKSGETKAVPPPPPVKPFPKKCDTDECKAVQAEIYAFAEERFLRPILSKFPAALAAAIKYMKASKSNEALAEIEYEDAKPKWTIPGRDAGKLDLATTAIHFVKTKEQLLSLLSAMKHLEEVRDSDVNGLYARELAKTFMSMNVDPLQSKIHALDSQKRIRLDTTISQEAKDKMTGFIKDTSKEFVGTLPPPLKPGKLYPSCAGHKG